jgi:hypothetical protein
MLQWADQYGGVFKFSLGCQWVVVVSDPAVAIQVREVVEQVSSMLGGQQQAG